MTEMIREDWNDEQKYKSQSLKPQREDFCLHPSLFIGLMPVFPMFSFSPLGLRRRNPLRVSQQTPHGFFLHSPNG